MGVFMKSAHLPGTTYKEKNLRMNYSMSFGTFIMSVGVSYTLKNAGDILTLMAKSWIEWFFSHELDKRFHDP